MVVIAAIVPIGIDFWASRRSPDRLEPAMMPASGSQLELVKTTNYVKVDAAERNNYPKNKVIELVIVTLGAVNLKCYTYI